LESAGDLTRSARAILPRAIAEMLDGKVVEWMEHVTDEQYGR
jgi:hypothetical protein